MRLPHDVKINLCITTKETNCVAFFLKLTSNNIVSFEYGIKNNNNKDSLKTTGTQVVHKFIKHKSIEGQLKKVLFLSSKML